MIRMRNIAKAFNRRSVLRDVNVEFDGGRITAVLGPNGCGKTTLIRIVLGLVRPDSGTIEIGGRDIRGGAEYRADIGYMPQAARFPENLTGREIIAMLEDLRGAGSILDRDLIAEFDLEAELDRPVRVLSGGTRQKISAAAAFLFDPIIAILDEPTAGLDPVASGILKDKLIRERARGRAIVITSHVLSEVEQIADDIVVLVDGGVLHAGTLDDLRRSTGETILERAVAQLMIRRGRDHGVLEFPRRAVSEGRP